MSHHNHRYANMKFFFIYHIIMKYFSIIGCVHNKWSFYWIEGSFSAFFLISLSIRFIYTNIQCVGCRHIIAHFIWWWMKNKCNSFIFGEKKCYYEFLEFFLNHKSELVTNTPQSLFVNLRHVCCVNWSNGNTPSKKLYFLNKMNGLG